MATIDIDDSINEPLEWRPEPRKYAIIETSTGKCFRVVVHGVKEHEALEIIDLLRSKGMIA